MVDIKRGENNRLLPYMPIVLKFVPCLTFCRIMKTWI